MKLKVKDNVNFDELKKYGFKYEMFDYMSKTMKDGSFIRIDLSTNDRPKGSTYYEPRKLFIEGNREHIQDTILETIYDLIADGLIENFESPFKD